MPKGLMALLSNKEGSSPMKDGGGDSLMSDAKLTAAEDALAAFKSGDADSLSDALERHYKACQHNSPSEEGESEEDEDSY